MRHVPQDDDPDERYLQADEPPDQDRLAVDWIEEELPVEVTVDLVRNAAPRQYESVQIDITLLNSRTATDAEWEREFTKLFKGYERRLDHHFSYMLPEKADRDDLIQELFIRAYRACRLSEDGIGLTHSDAAWKWLVRIGTNLHRDGLEFQEANERKLAKLAEHMETEQALISAAADVLERLAREDIFSDGTWTVDEETFRERLSQLDTDDHRLLTLRFQHGLEWRAIAAELGIESAAARKRFERMAVFLRTGIAPLRVKARAL